MPFVSDTQSKELEQHLETAPRIQDYSRYGFGESFAAGVGGVFDEELSISAVLNNEGWSSRKDLIDRKVRAGEITDIDGYRNWDGRFNYDALARDLKDPDVKTDKELHEERNSILAHRRDYREKVQRGGDSLGFFLGGMTGYVLDPISVASMPYGYSVAAAKSVSALGLAARTAVAEGLINASTEILIQPLVYAHKQEIDSPYSVQDAINNIGMAAAGGLVFGGISGGISGYLKKIKADFDDAINKGLTVDAETEKALESIDRTIKNLEELKRRQIDVDTARKEITEDARADLIARSGERLTRGEEKILRSERRQLFDRLSKVETTTADVDLELKDVKTKRVPARKAKELAKEAAEEVTAEEIASIKEKINLIDSKLGRHNLAKQAEADLSRLEQGILPKKQKELLEQIEKEAVEEMRELTDLELIEKEKSILQQMEDTRIKADQPSKTPELYKEPEIEPPPSDLKGFAEKLQREMDVSEPRDIAKFETIEKPLTFDPDGNLVDAQVLVKTLDDEINNLNEIHACAYGKPS